MWVLRNTNTSKEREQLTTLKYRQGYISIQTLAPSCSAPDKYSGKDSFAQDERSFSWTRISHVVTSAFERTLQACHSMAMPNNTTLIVLYVSEVVDLGMVWCGFAAARSPPCLILGGWFKSMQYWFFSACVSCCLLLLLWLLTCNYFKYQDFCSAV